MSTHCEESNANVTESMSTNMMLDPKIKFINLTEN